METSFLLKAEIISFLILLWYITYYLGSFSLHSSRKLRKLLWIWKKTQQNTEKQFKVKVSNSEDAGAKEHGKNRKKLSNEEKLHISELLKRIKINIGKREFDIAKNLIIEGLTIDKFNPDLNLELANIYIEEEEYIKAEYIYKDLILIHSENVEILKKLWYVLSIQEKFDMAIQMYKKAYKLQKWDIEVLNMLTQLNFYTWDYLSCIKYAKKFLKLKPKDSENLQLLASAYEKSQSIKEALEVYKELSNLKPYDTKIQSKIEALSVE